MMYCLNLNSNGVCTAGVRRSDISKQQGYHRYDQDLLPCQYAISNPVSANYYPRCQNCDPMGSLQSGDVFRAEWPANMENDRTFFGVGDVYFYLSPRQWREIPMDFSEADFQTTLICQVPFNLSCSGLGVTDPCYAECMLPNVQMNGIYTIQWYWYWEKESHVFTTCADVYITAQPTTQPPTTTGITSGGSSTTGHHPPSTTGRRPTPAPRTATPSSKSGTSTDGNQGSSSAFSEAVLLAVLLPLTIVGSLVLLGLGIAWCYNSRKKQRYIVLS